MEANKAKFSAGMKQTFSNYETGIRERDKQLDELQKKLTDMTNSSDNVQL